MNRPAAAASERSSSPERRRSDVAHEARPPSAGKRKVSVTLDADLVAEVEAAGDNLSAQVNSALRDELERRRRQRALSDLLARLDAEHGPLDSPGDEAEINRFMRLLGGE
nr:type II toxin-antitoxin system CcdA family antitoxin [Micromonospora sp. DSM 115978]